MNTYTIFQIIISLLLIVAVILQSRGNEAGISFSSKGDSYRSKKGFEKFLFYLTIILAVIFASTAIFSLILA